MENIQKLKDYILYLSLLLMLEILYLFIKYSDIIIKPYQEFWQFMTALFISLFVLSILLVYKNKVKRGNQSLANILEGAAGGLVVYELTTLKTSGIYSQILGFVSAVILFIIYIFYANPKLLDSLDNK